MARSILCAWILCAWIAWPEIAFAAAPALERPASAAAESGAGKGVEYLLGPGDEIKISVFQNPDLTLETRVSESGAINYPLIGSVKVGGSTIAAAEQRIARLLSEGNFVVGPQVSILVMQVRGNQVAVLGQVNRPGRYPLETTDTKLTDVIAIAGGISPAGSDIVIFTGIRDGRLVRKEFDAAGWFLAASPPEDPVMQAGDSLYVHRAPMFYIYGEVQRPGNYRVERNMTLMQALATGGGLTPKGTQRGVRLSRRDADGKMRSLDLKPEDLIQADDVIFVRESLF
jgi:polysaccharide export outer membrane protein